MTVGRTAPAGAVGSDGRIYVFGGITSTGLWTAAEAYDPDTDRWETLPSMPTAREAAAAVALGSRILVFGGTGGATVVEYYDVVTRQWGTLATMPTARSDFGAPRSLMGGYSWWAASVILPLSTRIAPSRTHGIWTVLLRLRRQQ